MANDQRTFMGYMWLQNEENVVTLGINEEGLQDFEEISSVELPTEGEKVDADTVIGTIETDDGPLDIYAPVDGTILEVNSNVLEDPSLIQEDPFEEGWLVKIESEDTSKADDDEDDEDDDDDESDEDDDYADDED